MSQHYTIEYQQRGGIGGLEIYESLPEALNYRPNADFAKTVRLYITLVRTRGSKYIRQELYRWHQGQGRWRPL